jgi:thiosulfate/3-mercaptopyruvate sulfurtransferase
VNNKGKLRLPGVLRELYAAAGVPAEGKQIAFCNTGHDAAIGWFVSSEILGNKAVKLYDGSLAEWSVDPHHPMESKIRISD